MSRSSPLSLSSPTRLSARAPPARPSTYRKSATLYSAPIAASLPLLFLLPSLSPRSPSLPSPRPNPFLPPSFAFEMKNVRIFWPTMIPLTMPSESVRVRRLLGRARGSFAARLRLSVVCISQEIKVQHRNPPSSFSHSPPSSLPISPSHRCESPSPHCNSVAGTSASVASPFPSMATIRQNGSGDRLGESGSKDKGGWRRLAESHLAAHILSVGPLAT